MIKLTTLIRELSYGGNIGVMELIDFYNRATDEQQIKLERLMNAKKWDAAWILIQQTTNSKLVGFPQRMPADAPTSWKASRKGAS